MRDIVALHRGGIGVPQVVVPDWAMREVLQHLEGRHPVVLTLRECEHQTARNSNYPAWRDFGRWLEERGERVIMVRDTRFADQVFNTPGMLTTYPEASRDLHIRAALYGQAKMNFFVSNGPWTLACFSDWPWCMFVRVEEGEAAEVNQPWYWRDYMGVDQEGQLPWQTPHQRIMYEPDTFENLKRAWERLPWPMATAQHSAKTIPVPVA
jgi:hypothetical protein